MAPTGATPPSGSDRQSSRSARRRSQRRSGSSRTTAIATADAHEVSDERSAATLELISLVEQIVGLSPRLSPEQLTEAGEKIARLGLARAALFSC